MDLAHFGIGLFNRPPLGRLSQKTINLFYSLCSSIAVPRLSQKNKRAMHHMARYPVAWDEHTPIYPNTFNRTRALQVDYPPLRPRDGRSKPAPPTIVLTPPSRPPPVTRLGLVERLCQQPQPRPRTDEQYACLVARLTKSIKSLVLDERSTAKSRKTAREGGRYRRWGATLCSEDVQRSNVTSTDTRGGRSSGGSRRTSGVDSAVTSTSSRQQRQQWVEIPPSILKPAAPPFEVKVSPASRCASQTASRRANGRTRTAVEEWMPSVVPATSGEEPSRGSSRVGSTTRTDSDTSGGAGNPPGNSSEQSAGGTTAENRELSTAGSRRESTTSRLEDMPGADDTAASEQDGATERREIQDVYAEPNARTGSEAERAARNGSEQSARRSSDVRVEDELTQETVTPAHRDSSRASSRQSSRSSILSKRHSSRSSEVHFADQPTPGIITAITRDFSRDSSSRASRSSMLTDVHRTDYIARDGLDRDGSKRLLANGSAQSSRRTSEVHFEDQPIPGTFTPKNLALSRASSGRSSRSSIMYPSVHMDGLERDEGNGRSENGSEQSARGTSGIRFDDQRTPGAVTPALLDVSRASSARSSRRESLGVNPDYIAQNETKDASEKRYSLHNAEESTRLMGERRDDEIPTPGKVTPSRRRLSTASSRQSSRPSIHHSAHRTDKIAANGATGKRRSQNGSEESARGTSDRRDNKPPAANTASVSQEPGDDN